ncbi:hypothetical protein ACLOJK_026076 [Asimina triloba]
MALTTPSNSKSISFAIVLTAIAATSALIFFAFLPSLSSSICSCPARHPAAPTHQTSAYTRPLPSPPPLATAAADISWVKDQLRINGIPDPPSTPEAWHSLRKGINPRTREQQLDDFRRCVHPLTTFCAYHPLALAKLLPFQVSMTNEARMQRSRAVDLVVECLLLAFGVLVYDARSHSLVLDEESSGREGEQKIIESYQSILFWILHLEMGSYMNEYCCVLSRYKGISHYGDPDEAKSHTAFPCPGELLVEEHHSNYGEPWAGGRDVFEFIAGSTNLSPDAQVLEIGCGTLRVGLHFIRYLNPGKFHCLERDNLSLMAALAYELPSQGLLYKRPMIIKGEDMDFSRFGSDIMFDLIYASAVFLHMPDNLVWVGLERLSTKLRPYEGRIFISHNIKFCSRLGGDECTKRLTNLGLEYVGKKTHDSLLFNHYEIWFEFRRSKA